MSLNDGSMNCPGKCEKLFSASVQPEKKHLIHNHSYPPLIYNLEVSPLQKAAHLGLPSQDGLHQLSGDLLFLLITQRHVPLLEPELALSTEQEHELHLELGDERKQMS